LSGFHGVLEIPGYAFLNLAEIDCFPSNECNFHTSDNRCLNFTLSLLLSKMIDTGF